MTAIPAKRLPRFVRAFRSRQYHHVKRELSGRYLTACDVLIVRWQVSNTPFGGLGLCPKCAAELERGRAGDEKGAGQLTRET